MHQKYSFLNNNWCTHPIYNSFIIYKPIIIKLNIYLIPSKHDNSVYFVYWSFIMHLSLTGKEKGWEKGEYIVAILTEKKKKKKKTPKIMLNRTLLTQNTANHYKSFNLIMK